MSTVRRPSLLGALIWLGLGILFLLHNFGIGPDFLILAGRYWPVLLILLGMGKIIDYFVNKDISIRVGEVFGILVLLLIGTFLTRISETHIGHLIGDVPIRIGGTLIRPGQFMRDSHTHLEETAYPLESSAPILIRNSYGLVSVTPGSDREVRVRLRKVVYANEERARDLADRIRLNGGYASGSIPGSGEKEKTGYFQLETTRDSLDSSGVMFSTDMEVLVPRKAEIHIVNSFGEISVRNIEGKLNLKTTQKPLSVQDCTGDVSLSSRYGEVKVLNVSGNLDVEARGNVYVRKIKGDVEIMNEFAPVQISDVDGKVTASTNESSIRAENISNAVTIHGRGSEVRVSNIRGSLMVASSHRAIEIGNVTSNVRLESSYASVKLNGVKGDIDVTSNFDTINAGDLGGSFRLKAQRTGVMVKDIRGALDIQTTLKDVIVDGFRSSCTITNQYAGISLTSWNLGKEDVSVRNSNGKVSLFLPEGASFDIDAVARNGRIESEYPGLEPVRQSDVALVKSKVNSGGPTIRIQADYGNIYLFRTRDREHRQMMMRDFGTWRPLSSAEDRTGFDAWERRLRRAGVMP